MIVRLADTAARSLERGAADRVGPHGAAPERPLDRRRRRMSPSSRARQDAAVAAVRAAIPKAVVQERYSILLDGFAVQLPAKSLPKLLRVSGVTKVYPSLAYYATMDRGPSVIHATDLQAATGDKGQGVKIAVVDTGVDPTSPFLNPAGFSYPPGFPKGDTTKTTPKVIVAKVFPGELRDKNSAKPFDPTEPHGTHVSGIAAGDEGTNAPAGPDHPAVANLSGVAPKAWIGNYRVFTVPTPLGHEASTPEIVHAFEAAVADGMNVINFSGGGPQTDPVNDAMFETIHNVTLAGVVPVIAAGNDREDFGFGTAGTPGVAPDAIAVAATSNSHVFAPALSVTGGPPVARRRADPGRRRREAAGRVVDARPDDRRRHRRSWAPTESRSTRISAARRATRTPATARCPAGSLTGKIALASRGICTFASKAERAKRAGAIGLILADNRFGEANAIPIQLSLPAGMISDLDGVAAPRLRVAARRPGDDPRLERHPRDPDRAERRDHELLVRRPDRLRLVPEAGHLRARVSTSSPPRRR